METTILEEIRGKIKDGKKLSKFENAIFKLLDEDEQHRYFSSMSEISDDIGDICNKMSKDRAIGMKFEVMNLLAETYGTETLEQILNRDDIADSLKNKLMFWQKTGEVSEEIKIPVSKNELDADGNVIGKRTYETLKQLPINQQGNNIIGLIDNITFEVLLYGLTLGYLLSKEGE